jgi:hypothetical protein
VAAVHDARRAAEKVAGDAMGSVAGGLDLSAMGLPAGLGFPGGGAGFADADDDEFADDEEEDDEEDEDAAFADARAIDEETDEVYRREFEQGQVEQARSEQGPSAPSGA